MKKHIHYDAIVAWAGGARIQHREKGTVQWIDCNHIPEWRFDHEYRVAPDYPASRMTTHELREAARVAVFISPPFSDHGEAAWRGVADAALRHACDAGHVVRREEFDRAVAGREAHDMAIAIAVRNALHDAAMGALFGLRSEWTDQMKLTVDGVNLSAIIAGVKVEA